MKGRKLMNGLSMISPKYIQEAEFDGLSKGKEVKKHSGKILALIVAACMLLGLAITAYAANLFSIRELFKTHVWELPEEADSYIHEETVSRQSGEGWNCEITESLADNATVMVTVAIHGGDKYIIAPTYDGPDDSVGEIGIFEDKTLGDYAAEKGKTLLFVGASITKVGDMEGINGSQRMESISDNEMLILSKTSQTVDTSNPNAVITVYAREDGKEEVERIELPVVLNAAPQVGEELVFHPVKPDAIPGMTVGDLHVTETALGYNLEMLETVTDQQKWYEIMKVEIDGLTYSEGGGVLRDDGNWYFEVNMCQGTVGDTMTLRYYDWDKQPIGEIKFRK